MILSRGWSTLLLSCLAVAASPGEGRAQTPDQLRAEVRQWREANEAGILAELRDLLAMPNLASDSVHIRRNAAHLITMLERRGVRARLLETPGSPPAVYGELPARGATRTVVLYAHYDGQPVDSSRWASDPWVPVLRSGSLADRPVDIPFPAAGERVDPEARIYARSASDDKAPIVAMLAALDALRAAGVTPSVNLKFFFEGEEEAGSRHLREMLTRHAGLLQADAWLFLDGPVHQSRRHQIVFGVRGVLGLRLTVFGPSRPLHSGHYGNWAPNPNILLAHLLASLRDLDGRITIPGYYDDVRPPGPAEREAIEAIGTMDDALRRELGLAATEADNAPLMERLLLPAMNVGGLDGGPVRPRGANLIGTEAGAYIDFRLVPDQTPARVREQVERFLRSQGWHVVHGTPEAATRATHARLVEVRWMDGGYPATQTAMDLPLAQALVRTAREALGAEVLSVPILGGSLPLYHFVEVLGAPVIVLPIVNHDNNQHGENENVRLRNLWDGIELIAGLLARLGAVWPPAT